MELPRLNNISKQLDTVSVFNGYDHNPIIGDGEFYEEENLTSDNYPLLSPRERRGTFLDENDFTLTHEEDGCTVGTIAKAAFLKKAGFTYGEYAFVNTMGGWTINGESTNLGDWGIAVIGSADNDATVTVTASPYEHEHSFGGLISKTELCYVDGEEIVVGTRHINLGLTPGKKQLVSMGGYLIILPDKKYVNTADIAHNDYGDIEARAEKSGGVTFALTRADGSTVTIDYTQDTEPEDPGNGEYWIDTSSEPNVLKQYAETSGMWVTIPTVYVKISATDIGKDFAQYDGVDLSITKINGHYKDAVSGNTFDDPELDALCRSLVVQERGDDYIVVVGMLSVTRQIDNTVKISRTMPDMDFVVESHNRLWGCRYAPNYGNYVNEIYACKLGDFKNWRCYMGVSTDSYTASIGTDGPFTGAVAHLGYPIFFKENCMHKVYGNYPSNFQIQDTACRGVQNGSGASVAIVDEVVYYKSVGGICAYDGSLPAEISQALGNERYTDAVGGGGDGKYYVSMADKGGAYHLFVYDTQKRIWHREDGVRASAFATVGTETYFIDEGLGRIRTVHGSGLTDTDKISWMAETGKLTLAVTTHKYISKLLLRMSLDLGTTVRFYIQYDSVGMWECVATMSSQTLRSIDVPIRPKRCDHFRLRIVGEGDARIYSAVKYIEQGSENR